MEKGSFKHIIGYDDNDYIGPISMLPLMIGYVKCFDDNKTMSCRITGNKLKEYQSMGKRKQLNENEVNANFQDEEVLKENFSFVFFSLIILDSVIRVNKKYCP